MKTPVDFRARVEELRHLANCRPRRLERDIVMAALNSKWEGLQSVAAQTLGQWGDRESAAALREFWKCVSMRKHGNTIQRVVARSLGRCVKAPDADWLLDLYFSSPHSLQQQLLSAVLRLPPESTRTRFIQEASSSNRSRRYATLLAMGRMPFPDRLILLKRFLSDEDPEVRNVAHHLDKPFLPGES